MAAALTPVTIQKISVESMLAPQSRMDECLSYFRCAIQQPESVPPWDDWWPANEDLVRRSFERADFLNLKFRRLDAARTILERMGDAAVESPKQGPALSPATIAQIENICEASNSPERVVAALPSAQALQQLAYSYNWDDGFAVPTAIAQHPKCDLGVALDLFWLAEALCWYTREIEPNDYNREWVEFCRLVTDGLLSGRYRRGATSFKFPLSVVRLHELRKKGIPEVLISDVHGEVAAPFG